jgi:DNA-binding CsgD family transcriptional regulator
MNKRIEILKGVLLENFNGNFTIREQKDTVAKMLVYQPPLTSPLKRLRPLRWFEAVTLVTTHHQVQTYHIFRDNESKKYVVVIEATYYHANRLEINVKWEDCAAEYVDIFFAWLDQNFEYVTDDKAEVEEKTTPAKVTPDRLTSVEVEPEQRHIYEDRLSPREIEVADLMADGLTRTKIASLLGISPHTVKIHAAKIAKTLGIKGREKSHSFILRKMGFRTGDNK